MAPVAKADGHRKPGTALVYRADSQPMPPGSSTPPAFDSGISPSQPLRVAMIVPATPLSRAQVGALADRPELKVSLFHNLTKLEERRPASFDVLLVWVDSLSILSLTTLMRVSRTVTPLLAVDNARFLDAIPYFDYFDTPVFMDTPIDRQVAALQMAHIGYVLLPGYIGNRFAFDQLRLSALAQLSGRELATLARMQTGAINREIAGDLGISEATVKNAVRTVLKRLFFRNRTEAALFAVRWRAELAAAIDRQSQVDGET